MLSIVICEDNEIQLQKFKDIIEIVIAKNNYDFKLELCTSNPKDVIDYTNSKENLRGIYFFDVELKDGINGIKLAEQIRKKDALGYIIFVTTHSEMSFLTFKYKVEAMDYIIKDSFDEIEYRIEKCLEYIDHSYYRKNNVHKFFRLKQDDRVININLDDILFIETSPVPHKLIIHQKRKQLEIYGTLKELEEKLPEEFYRCHRAYIVNKNNVKELDKRRRIIYMVNGEQCLISFRYIGGLMK
ncbi:LytR/AlgR family response regulator transcription factor [Hathewaya limosa]|uniref:Stage 0 sporulation protein A homolog n=1 Tax=Hathewaya limosa TaxID=1536 RepID=A0ABU0JY14_HATLI|nr:LytTR family DNA-binding domain-containing protein [Hathewaya limosa]AWZ47577.1 DNA-binding response regulator [Clostridiaceae bacterium 14S0207]MDQ0480807.1 two-component system response regulator AgrA [Hathewaya limosa]